MMVLIVPVSGGCFSFTFKIQLSPQSFVDNCHLSTVDAIFNEREPVVLFNIISCFPFLHNYYKSRCLIKPTECAQ